MTVTVSNINMRSLLKPKEVRLLYRELDTHIKKIYLKKLKVTIL